MKAKNMYHFMLNLLKIVFALIDVLVNLIVIPQKTSHASKAIKVQLM